MQIFLFNHKITFFSDSWAAINCESFKSYFEVHSYQIDYKFVDMNALIITYRKHKF